MPGFWGLDLGKHALKAVKLNLTKAAPEIAAVEYIEYGGSPDAGDGAGRVQEALREFARRQGVRRDRLVASLPGTAAFSRIIKLPPVEAKRIDEIVRYEAQQQIPFPIDEVVWDYQQIERSPEDTGEELEVGIFAIKKEQIQGFLQSLSEVGIEPDAITITPLAIYNFVKAEMAGLAQTAVVVDIGADHTDLVVVDGNRLWIRNLALAGNEVTRALAEKFQIPFEEAEDLKCKATKSPQAQKIFGVMQPVLKDFIGEIHRSVGFYKSQSKDARIEDIFIVGDSTKLVGLKNFFAQELRYEVHRYTKLTSLEVGEECDEEVLKEHLSAFAVAIGLALQGAGLAPIRASLLPKDVARRKEIASKRPYFAAAVVIMAVAILTVWGLKQGRVDDFDAQIARMGTLQTYDTWEKQCKAVENGFKGHQDRAVRLLTMGRSRRLALDALAAVDRSLPPGNADLDLGDLGPSPFDRDIIQKFNAKGDGKLWLHRVAVERLVEAGETPRLVHKFTLEGMVVAVLDPQQRVLNKETIDNIEERLKRRVEDALNSLFASAEEGGEKRRIELRLVPEQQPRRWGLSPDLVERDPRLKNARQYFLFKYEFEI